ncbi:FimV/HubP family polar landmark protein [Aliikangiella coralliicola]|uniref:FimV family protein n=1 Tax=Aliikangiella coralliicola TaxID=2592383 RepID=A0A545U0H8_9GAMM|nr:FimV/HubP family polar landmark protein [Aliikangiella coralliicola]TQV82970.1 FimV family protein [Aliikangiella coralliicola]
MFRKLILLIVSAVGFYSSTLVAVGLGEYELKSGLNQPLSAEIVLLSAGDLAEHELHASLASAQEFEKVGVERLFFLNNIRFETIRSDSGEVIIKLTTREPIKEPFVNFLVELNWPNGRIIREYTFLLDPPIFEDSTASTIERTQTSRQQSSQQSTQRAEPSAPQTTYTPSQNTQPTFSGSTYGPVSPNDTLWSIASKTRPDSQVTIHQTLVAIYRANPHAFANGNINNLMRGEVLQIPDANTISQVPHRAALQDVVTQNRQWRSGGARRIVGNDTGGTTSSQMTGEGRLSLAAPDTDSGTDGSSGGSDSQLSQVRNQLVSSQEKSATLQAENDELRARLADALAKLESVSDSAVNITDTELAALTQQSQDSSTGQNDEVSSGNLDTTEGEAISGEISDSDSSIAETGSDIGSDTTDSTLGDSTATDSDSATSAEQAGGSDATQTPTPANDQATTGTDNKKPIFAQEPKPKGFVEELMESGGLLWGGILGVIALIAMAVFWRMRKRMEEDDFQDDLVASAGAGSMDTTETFELPDVGDDMLVELDMDESADASPEQEEESFDPLGEADIYIAYGKYEQAESLLLEAIEENPIRSDVKVKLMECYAETEDKDKFEALAQEVSQAVDADEWAEQIGNLRAQAWSGEADSEDGFDLPSTEDIFGDDEDDSFAAEIDAVDDEAKSSDDISDDFSLDETEADEEEFDIDMDLGLDDEETPAEASSDAVTETFDSLDDDDFSIDEDLMQEQESEEKGLDEDDFALDLDEDADDIELDDGDDIGLDLDDDEFDFDDDDTSDFDGAVGDDSTDEIATKLDLARAYIDMGDADGAKEILSEVVSEGSDSQKSEAQALLDKVD